MTDEPSPLLVDTAKAIHTLFFATVEAGERYRALRDQLSTDDELAAYQCLSVGLIDFRPLPEETLEKMRTLIEAREAEAAVRDTGNPRVTVTASIADPDFDYACRLLTYMYSRWDGTLDYERGVHRFSFFSQSDKRCRWHSVFAQVAVDGEASEVRCRSYTLGPYLRVKDFRTGRESDDPWRVLHGDLMPILPPAPGVPDGSPETE